MRTIYSALVVFLLAVSLPSPANAGSKFGRKVATDAECRESETLNKLWACTKLGKDADGLPTCAEANWEYYCENTKKREARLKKEAKANEGEIDLDK